MVYNFLVGLMGPEKWSSSDLNERRKLMLLIIR